MAATRLDAVVSLAKRRGFVYPCGEIYGGTKSAWDYGPLGVELKDNIKRQWWNAMVRSREDIVGLDSSVILPRQVWVASGHVAAFVDPLVECTSCHKRYRADHLEEEYRGEEGSAAGERAGRHPLPELRHPGRLDRAQGVQRAAEDLPRPGRGRVRACITCDRKPRRASSSTTTTWRPRRARSRRSGSARSASRSATRSPRATSSSAPVSSSRWRWSSSSSPAPTRNGISTGSTPARRGTSTWASPGTTCGSTSTRRRSSRTTPSAPSTSSTGSISATNGASSKGIANRTDFDLKTHSEHSGVDLSYFDQETGERWTPYVVEPAAGVNRAMIAFLLEAYAEDEAPNTKGGVDKRTVLRLDPRLAPVKAAVLPLSRHADLSPIARDLAASLRKSLERRVRRCRADRPPVPPAGRDRHPVLSDRRLRHRRRPGGDHSRPGLDDAGAGRPGPGAEPTWRLG